MAVYSQSATFRDIKGHTATVRIYMAAAADAPTTIANAAAWSSALAAMSNAQLQSVHGPNTSSRNPPAYGTNAPYPDVEDKAVLTFYWLDGSIHRVKVPAPKAAIFLADQTTVDPANAAVVAFVSAYEAAIGTAMEFQGGLRTRVANQRRSNINVRTPQLTGSEPAE